MLTKKSTGRHPRTALVGSLNIVQARVSPVILALDLYCGAGGAGKGYALAGFRVVGVDLQPQPHYPFDFIQSDALMFAAKNYDDFDIIHASPPCQAYSRCRFLPQNKNKQYPDLIEPTRSLLRSTHKPYIIENVPGSPLINPIWLNGLMFGLKVIRKRGFETSPWLLAAPLSKVPKKKLVADISEFERGQYGYMRVCGQSFSVPAARIAMGIDWMTRKELAQAIPPSYTHYLGTLLKSLLHW